MDEPTKGQAMKGSQPITLTRAEVTALADYAATQGKAPGPVYSTVTIEIMLWEEDEPLTAAEIENLAHHGPSSWEDWNVIAVGPRRERSEA